jgi:oligopeptide/dipeptide ABC transporter ATP-binding protein
MSQKAEPILEFLDWRVSFRTRRGTLRAVNGVSFQVHPGETLAVVGESGSGKSVTQMSWLGLLPSPPMVVEGGDVLFKGKSVLHCTAGDMRALRGNRVSVVFQEPMTALNPYMRVGEQVAEPLVVHRGMAKAEAARVAEKWLERVGIPDAATAMRRYPHEFSGGQRQRILIAMALVTGPELLIADEPTTALDVTVQAQVLALLKELQRETGMAVVLITHDLGVVAEVADRVVVLYGGRVLEEGTVDSIFYRSAHPYTAALLGSTPRLDRPQAVLPSIDGAPPSLLDAPVGCPFAARCPRKLDVCTQSFPSARHGSGNHRSFCHWEGALK